MLKPVQMLVLLQPACTELCLRPAPAIFSSNKQKKPIIIKCGATPLPCEGPSSWMPGIFQG